MTTKQKFYSGENPNSEAQKSVQTYTKLTTYFSSLKTYANTEICSPDYLALRYTSPAGRVVAEYISDVAVLTRDLFRKSSMSRLDFQYEVDGAIENDSCWNHDDLIQGSKYILRFCSNCNREDCPFKVIFVQFQLR